MLKKKAYLLWLGLAATIVLCDQLSKYIIMQNLLLYQLHALSSFLNLTLIYNSGAAFSFLSQHTQLAFWLFSLIAIVISVVLVVGIKRLPARQPLMAAALSLVLGGAVGNVIDRFTHGYVVDFLDFHYQGWHFPAFNVADSAISLGAVLLLVYVVFNRRG